MPRRMLVGGGLIVALLTLLAMSLPVALGAVTAAPPAAAPRLLFGLGPTAEGASQQPLTKEAPVRMLTTWYNGPNDLNWLKPWKNDRVPNSYAQGYALHLIVYSSGPRAALTTTHGPACGIAYPLSSEFLTHITELAQTFAGSGPLYVTLFTEFQTYTCTHNQWPGNENYWQALKDRYREALALFHQHAPNSQVSLGWGGWQSSWAGTPDKGDGRLLFGYFADALGESDFQSFQAMDGASNVEAVRQMTQILGAYGPVLLAHYKPDNGSQATFDADTRAMLTDSFLTEMTAAGLFAWSFMDHNNLSASDTSYQFVKDAVRRYGTAAGSPPPPPAPPPPTPSPSPTSPAPAQPALRIRAGGGAYTDKAGQVWAADKDSAGGQTRTQAAAIADTADDPLYQAQRYGTFTYALSAANGSYNLALHFVERTKTGANQRLFDVKIEGQTALSRFDVFAAAGGAQRAVWRIFPVTLSDGVLNLDFVGRQDDATVSAIALTPPGARPAAEIAFTTPRDGASVSGLPTVQAQVSGVPAATVRYFVNGVQKAAVGGAFVWTWDTTKASQGRQLLAAKAYDRQGTLLASAAISVTVASGGRPGSGQGTLVPQLRLPCVI